MLGIFKHTKTSLLTHKYFLLFSIIYVIFSLATYKDYGITFDEKVEYDAGKYLYTYYKTPTTQQYLNEMIYDGPINIETRHLPMFSVYSRIYPMILTLVNIKYYFEWFHLLNLFFGYLLFLFSYLLFLLEGIHPNKAFLAPLLLFLTSYVTGHIPANPKDIPFAWSYLIGIFTILYFGIKVKDFRYKVLVTGLIFGVTVSLRAIGITLILISFLYDILYQQKNFLISIIEHIYVAVCMFFVWILCMPWLGSNFLANVYQALLNAKSYSDWNGTLFYLGHFINKYQIPWHYLFVLIGFKLPIPLLFGFLAASFYFVFNTAKKIKTTPIEFLLFTSIFLNITLYLVTKPVVYNGIRHFLYLIIIIVLFSVNYLIKTLKRSSMYTYAVILYFIFTGLRMVILHPYEYVYFNELSLGLRNASNLFQLDYWGASYKEASDYAQYLIRRNNLSDLKVFTCDSKFAVDYYSKMKYRMVSSPKEADIIFCDNFRDTIRNFKQPVIHTVDREHVPLLYIRIQPIFQNTYDNLTYR